MKTTYVAHDGTVFEDAELCLAYERMADSGDKSRFHEMVRSLFKDCSSYMNGAYPGDPSYKVFQVDDSREFDQFKAALFKALPNLMAELEGFKAKL